MKKGIMILFSLVCLIALAGCSESATSNTPSSVPTTDYTSSLPLPDLYPVPMNSVTPEKTAEGLPLSEEPIATEVNIEMKLNVKIGEHTFKATLEDNEAVDAFVQMMKEAPVVIQMSDHGGFEKVGPLGQSLPASNHQTTTQPGDIVLYNGNQIVMFYGSNSWSYTRLGRIDDLSGWTEALSSGTVTVTFSIEIDE